MTAPTTAPAAPAATERSSRLGRHALALALVLLVLVPVLGRGRLFSADEGAVAAQTHLLTTGQGWWLDHPLPEVDPEGDLFPLHLSNVADGKGAPFAKHPLYPALLVPFDRVGGVPAMVLVSLAGTLGAALAAAALARRLRPGTAPAALWLVGLTSPLFFYGYVLIAHTIGAAVAGWATVLALEGGRRTRVVGVAALVLLATLLRSEAVLFGLGLGAGLGLVAVLRRDRTLVAPAVAAGLAAIVGRFVDGALASVVASGSGSINPVAAEGGSFLGSRLAGAVVTWVLPSYDGVGPDDLLLVGVVLFGVAAVVVARRHPEDGSGVRLFAVLAAACGVAHLALPAGAVPGLLVAFPVLAVGLAGIDRRLLADRTAVVLAATYVAYVGAVLATQYSSGGSGEWGGRYFTLGLPLIVPLVLAGLAAVGDRLDEGTRRVATGALVVLAATTTLGAALALHDHQAMTARTVALVEDAVAATPDAVVVATDGTTGRFAWREVVGGADWLLVEDESRLAEVGEALAATGRPVVVSTYDADAYLDDLAPWYRVVGEERPEAGSSRVVVRLAPR